MESLHPLIREDIQEILAAPIEWERFQNKTILITGANGLIASYLVETLLALSAEKGQKTRVIGLVRNADKARSRFAHLLKRTDFRLSVADVSSGNLPDEKCDYVIHAASPASPRQYLADPVGTMNSNLLGTHHLLRRALEWQSERFLYFSSSEVYGQPQQHQVSTAESDYGYFDILHPRACYAESKRAAETLIASYVAQFRLPAVIVRPFHTYGPGMDLDDGRVFADFLRDIVNRRNIVLRSDGRARRAFCYLSDATAGFFYAFLRGEAGLAYNVGNPAGLVSIAELGEIMTQLVPEERLRVERQFALDDSRTQSMVSTSCPNIERIQRLGWTPRYSPRDGFARTLRYFLSPHNV